MAANATPMFLGDVIRFANGKSIKPGGDGCYPVYGSNGIIGGSNDFRYENGIIIGRVGAYCGSVAFCPTKFWASDNTLVAFPASEHFDTKFLFYLLTDANLSRYAGGAAQPLMTQTVLKQVKVKVPPLLVQRRIADILSAYDDLIENNLRRMRILEEMARSLYREWFVDFRFPGHEEVSLVDSALGKIPTGWEVLNVENVCECVTDGSHFSPKSVEFGLPMASAKDMQEWGLRLDTCRQISSEDFEILVRNGCRPKKNDVLVAKDGSYLKHIFVMRDDSQVVLLSSIAILRPSKKINPHLLAATLAEDGNRKRLQGYVTGAALPRIILKDFKRFQIVVPSEAIQIAWSRIAKPLAAFCWNLVDQNLNLRLTRDLLLPRLLSGSSVFTDGEFSHSFAAKQAVASQTPGSERKPHDIISTGKRFCLVEESRIDFPPGGASSGALAAQQAVRGSVHDSKEPLPIDQTDRSDVLAVIRQVFSDGQPRIRENAIGEVARALGYGRVGHRIQDVLYTDLLTAVRRGILDNVEDELILLARSIAGYDRDFLKRQFLASIGRSWIERDDAIQNFCRWMGFRRTGQIIDETARSLIQGLLRESRLEADGPKLIRRSP